MSNNFKENILKGYVNFCNKNTTPNIPLRLFSLWPETNFMLDKFYSRPNIKIGNNKRGLRIKNSMRHIVGSARQYQNYPNSAELLGNLKELRDGIFQPFEYMIFNHNLDYPRYLTKTKNDTKIDQENNMIGRNFIKQNPKATDEEIMKYAFNQARNNYERQYAPIPILKAAPTKMLNWNSFGNIYYTNKDKPQKPSVFQRKMMEDIRSIKKDKRY